MSRDDKIKVWNAIQNIFISLILVHDIYDCSLHELYSENLSFQEACQVIININVRSKEILIFFFLFEQFAIRMSKIFPYKYKFDN